MNSGTANLLATAVSITALFFPLPAYGGDAGSSAASFLKFSPSPRGTGMGEAYTSITEDAYSAWWNPAVLAGVEGPELAATYNDSMEDVTTQSLSVAYPVRYGSPLGFNIPRLRVAPFQGYDAQGIKIGKVEASDIAVGGAYGRVLLKDEIERPVLNVGAGIKFISEKLDKVSANTAALDLGAVYYIRPANYWMSKAPAQEFRVAMAIKNIGPGLKFDKRSSPLPLAATLGGSWHSHPGAASLIEPTRPTRTTKYYAAFGAEYGLSQALAQGRLPHQALSTRPALWRWFPAFLHGHRLSMSPTGNGAMHKWV